MLSTTGRTGDTLSERSLGRNTEESSENIFELIDE